MFFVYDMPGLLADKVTHVVLISDDLDTTDLIIVNMEFRTNMTVFKVIETIVDRAQEETNLDVIRCNAFFAL